MTAIPTLDRPSTTRPAVVLLRYTVPIATVHVLALSVLWPALFSWTGVALCVAGAAEPAHASGARPASLRLLCQYFVLLC